MKKPNRGQFGGGQYCTAREEESLGINLLRARGFVITRLGDVLLIAWNKSYNVEKYSLHLFELEQLGKVDFIRPMPFLVKIYRKQRVLKEVSQLLKKYKVESEDYLDDILEEEETRRSIKHE